MKKIMKLKKVKIKLNIKSDKLINLIKFNY
jgi:hypothetical protein